jgi:DNA-binding transcriptional MerR regulator
MSEQFKHAVTIAEMARMVGLSRSRFYQLIGKAMPEPTRDDAGRPYYTEDQQRTILEVRRRNCGIDGKPILFYAPRNSVPASSPKRSLKKQSNEQHAEIVDGVRALGLAVNVAQVDAAIKELFPDGRNGVDPGEVIRAVFLSIKRRNSTDNVG